MQQTVRCFPTNGRLALYLERERISYARLGVVAMAIKIPVQATTRDVLLRELKREPCRVVAAPHSLADMRLSRCYSSRIPQDLFLAGLELMDASEADFFDRKVSYVKLSFAIFAASVTSNPTVLEDIRQGLKREFICPVNAYAISQWMNGHRRMAGSAPALLEESIKILRPDFDLQRFPSLTNGWFFR